MADSQPGVIYELGPHRLACGDATDPTLVAAALGGAVPAVVFTDPPYGVGYRINLPARNPGAQARLARKKKAVRGDASPVAAAATLHAALDLVPGEPCVFACCVWRSLEATRQALEGAGFEPRTCLVWRKTGVFQNLDRFAHTHELLLYAGPFGGQPTVEVDVWALPRARGVAHPTPKPTALPLRALACVGVAGSAAVVYDPFAGAGSTLLAAAEAGCRCVAVEWEPEHVDTIRRRYAEWARACGLDPGPGALDPTPTEVAA